jgi:hypothetical protein
MAIGTASGKQVIKLGGPPKKKHHEWMIIGHKNIKSYFLMAQGPYPSTSSTIPKILLTMAPMRAVACVAPSVRDARIDVVGCVQQVSAAKFGQAKRRRLVELGGVRGHVAI